MQLCGVAEVWKISRRCAFASDVPRDEVDRILGVRKNKQQQAY